MNRAVAEAIEAEIARTAKDRIVLALACMRPVLGFTLFQMRGALQDAEVHEFASDADLCKFIQRARDRTNP